MASELITGFAGAPHVGSDDMGAFQSGILGVGSYVLQTGQQLKATVASANKVTIGTGDLVMNGRHVRMATSTDLTIQNGTQGQKRNDLIVCRYQKASDGKETATLLVVKGTATTGTPADPSYNKTSILDGATTSDMPLYRIPITNLSVGTPVKLFDILTPLKTVGDSVTQMPIVRFGSTRNYTNGDGVIQIPIDNPTGRRPDAAFVELTPAIDDFPGRIYDLIVFQWDVAYINVRVRRTDTNAWAGSGQGLNVSWMCLWSR
ncbi:hypothetical protein ACLUWX_02330 [Bifidobacterium apri]|uniref:hypothetical protein n=1 Tax=Bifidobacterium apri TaxID=1769423 RepID=UPI00399466F2